MRALYNITMRVLDELPVFVLFGAMILFAVWIAASLIVRLFGPAY